MPAEFILDPDVTKVLRGHATRIGRLEDFSVGCEYDDNFFVVVPDIDDLPPDDEIGCGICYVVSGYVECFVCPDDPGGGGEEPCVGCTDGAADPTNWLLS